jgi:hypothetical protein
MILGMTASVFVHVVLSLIGIGSGLVVLYGLLVSKRLNGWTAVFLATTIATSVTGFFLPAEHFLPSHAVGIVSLIVLTVALLARFTFRLQGAWRRVYVLGAVTALYLNVFVLVAQLFLKVPPLKALAPTQSEPPFLEAQAAVLALFVVIGFFAAVRFRPEPASPADRAGGRPDLMKTVG